MGRRSRRDRRQPDSGEGLRGHGRPPRLDGQGAKATPYEESQNSKKSWLERLVVMLSASRGGPM